MPGTAFKFANWHGIISDDFTAYLPKLDDILKGGTAIVDKPDRIVRKVVVDGRTYYSKCFLPQARLADRIKAAIRRPVIFRLWNVHNSLIEHNIACPKPVLSAFDKDGGAYFLCTEVPFATARILLKTVPDEQIPAVFANSARAIAGLHRAGFAHGDCLPGNICLDNAGTGYFIDNDRTCEMMPFLNWNPRLRNLVQFCSHADYRDTIGSEQFVAFFVEYMNCYAKKTPSTKAVSEFIAAVNARMDVIKAQKKSSVKISEQKGTAD